MSQRSGADSGSPLPLGTALHRWFLRPPRPQGEVIEDRTVSFLELFYDLVCGRLAALYRPLVVALLLGAAAALAVGWARPAPWLLATLLDLILIATWSFAFTRAVRTMRDAPEPG